jgi:multidrug resistance efflux pump
LAIYSVKSNGEKQQTIFAMQDCYVDVLSKMAVVGLNEELFRLNALEVDRENFKLEQELEMNKLTEERLDKDYLDSLIYGPLNAAIEMATAVVEETQEELREYRERFQVGEVTRTDVAQAEGRLAEKQILLVKAKNDKMQKDIEIESQQRRFAAERQDLAERIDLNIKIRELYAYKSQFAGKVTYHTYQGAFIEKGDPICTIDVAIG